MGRKAGRGVTGMGDYNREEWWSIILVGVY
jgi:hypothetical protein